MYLKFILQRGSTVAREFEFFEYFLAGKKWRKKKILKNNDNNRFCVDSLFGWIKLNNNNNNDESGEIGFIFMQKGGLVVVESSEQVRPTVPCELGGS